MHVLCVYLCVCVCMCVLPVVDVMFDQADVDGWYFTRMG